MSRSMECPRCGAEIGDTYEPDDPSVGITGGWYCDACDLGVCDEDGPEPHDDDVQVFGAQSREERGGCPRCLGQLAFGYGLAGGGIGPYLYCTSCAHVIKEEKEKS